MSYTSAPAAMNGQAVQIQEQYHIRVVHSNIQLRP